MNCRIFVIQNSSVQEILFLKHLTEDYGIWRFFSNHENCLLINLVASKQSYKTNQCMVSHIKSQMCLLEQVRNSKHSQVSCHNTSRVSMQDGPSGSAIEEIVANWALELSHFQQQFIVTNTQLHCQQSKKIDRQPNKTKSSLNYLK